MDAWFVVKIGFLMLFFIYVIFAFVVKKQVGLMTRTLDVTFDKVIKILATIHLIVAIIIFILAVFLL